MTEVWQDMEFLTALDGELKERDAVDEGDGVVLAGAMAAFSMGYRYVPRDPSWIIWLTCVACALTALSLFGIIWWNL